MQKASNNLTSTISQKVLFGILAGVFLEYFDYTLYGFSAPYIIDSFFPSETPTIKLMLAWSVFAISFLLRPVGAIIFGHFADRFGRRHILILTIVMMCIATTGIGLLPTYHEAGLISSFALVGCRVIQGLAVSTEYSGCSTYLLEFKKSCKGLFSGIVTSASGFGIFSASMLVMFFNTISTHSMLIANWRWPFIIAGLLVGILGFYLRLDLFESPEFLKLKNSQKTVKIPLLQLIRLSPKALIRSVFASAYAGIAIILIEIYLPSYLQEYFKIHKSMALQLSTYLAFLEACFAIGWGGFSDKIGVSKTIFIAGVLMLIGIFPILYLFSIKSLLCYFIAATLLAFIVAAIDGPMAAYLINNFPTQVRYTGVSISYNLGAAIFGGLSPALIIMLNYHYHTTNILGYFLVLSSLIFVLNRLFLKQ